MVWSNMAAIVTESGKVSTQWKYDYATGKAEPFDCNTYDEFCNVRRNYLRQHCSYTITETGSEVEWKVENAIFHNIAGQGSWLMVISNPDVFYWEIASDKVPAEYCQYDDGWIEGEWEAYMIPGSEDNFRLFESKTIDDVSIEIVEMETKDIDAVQLAQFYLDQYDAPTAAPLLRTKNKVAKAGEEDDSYLPTELVQPIRWVYGGDKFDVSVGLGMFKSQPEWKLRAVTRLKYRISNAEFLGNWAEVNEIIQEDKLEGETTPVYYSLQGERVQNPQGLVICIQDGIARKIFIR